MLNYNPSFAILRIFMFLLDLALLVYYNDYVDYYLKDDYF